MHTMYMMERLTFPVQLEYGDYTIFWVDFLFVPLNIWGGGGGCLYSAIKILSEEIEDRKKQQKEETVKLVFPSLVQHSGDVTCRGSQKFNKK